MTQSSRRGADKEFMDSFFRDAREIFEVAKADTSGAPADFAVLVRADGGLHFIMESPYGLDPRVEAEGSSVMYRVTRDRDGVRLSGRSGGRTCSLEESRSAAKRVPLLRDQPAYSVISPLRIASAPEGNGGWAESV